MSQSNFQIETVLRAHTHDVGQLAELATNVVTSELHDRFAAFAAEYLDRAGARDVSPNG